MKTNVAAVRQKVIPAGGTVVPEEMSRITFVTIAVMNVMKMN